MAWTQPQHSRRQVDAAGDVLRSEASMGQGFDEALSIINNWRSCHAFPLNTFQMTLRNKARQVDPESLVAQRIKRLHSIRQKLVRMPRLKLSQIQDIAGCRAVVSDISCVNELVDKYENGTLKHKRQRKDDYISRPRESGYRGIHIIYKYYSPRNPSHNDLRIEMQFRSALQHAWATAVETVGTFTNQSLKSSLGDPRWLRFFALMGTAIAFREECPPVPGTPENAVELVTELRSLSDELDVLNRLEGYSFTLNTIESDQIPIAHYYLIELDFTKYQVEIWPFHKRELEAAYAQYEHAERHTLDQPGYDVVLASAESFAALRRAFPNYFLDTQAFLEELRQQLG